MMTPAMLQTRKMLEAVTFSATLVADDERNDAGGADCFYAACYELVRAHLIDDPTLADFEDYDEELLEDAFKLLEVIDEDADASDGSTYDNLCKHMMQGHGFLTDDFKTMLEMFDATIARKRTRALFKTAFWTRDCFVSQTFTTLLARRK